MKINIFVSLIVFITVCLSCNHNPEILSHEELQKIAGSCNKQLEKYFLNSDANQLAEIYSPDAKLCPDGMNFIHGRDSIKAFWIEDFKTSKVLEMKTKIYTVDGDELVIYETGKTSLKVLYNDSIYNATIKYINVWCKQPDGTYKLDVDFWNRNTR